MAEPTYGYCMVQFVRSSAPDAADAMLSLSSTDTATLYLT